MELAPPRKANTRAVGAQAARNPRKRTGFMPESSRVTACTLMSPASGRCWFEIADSDSVCDLVISTGPLNVFARAKVNESAECRVHGQYAMELELSAIAYLARKQAHGPVG